MKVRSSHIFTHEIQVMHKMHIECSRFVISMQAECAVTTDAKFRVELENIIGDLVPLELEAHNWCSALYCR